MLEVVTVVKDDLSGLINTFKSLLNQTDMEFTWLIIDGSIQPVSAQETFENATFEIKVVKQPPKGIYEAMNTGLMHATQDWIWFVNAGDVLADSLTIEKIRKTISNNSGFAAYGFSVRHIDSSGNIWHTSPPHLRHLVETGHTFAEINHQGFIASTNIMKFTGGFDTNLRYAADCKFMDIIANSHLILLTDYFVVNFIIGGASSQNISKTLEEIDLCRPHSETSKHFIGRRKLLILKTKLRLKIIEWDGPLLKKLFYLRKFVS
jgi:glycosyltransferase involved in cell wall biosynthesis